VIASINWEPGNMVLEIDKVLMLDDRIDPHEPRSAGQTAIDAATKQSPDFRSHQPQTRRRSHGTRRGGTAGCLDVQSVDRSFAGRNVVKGASLYVKRGEAVGLLGPNGAGKTTIFYMITGLIPVDSGQIELDGHDITRLAMYQRARLGIGYVPQKASTLCGLNVEQHIRKVLNVVEPDPRQREHDLDVLLEEFNIAGLRKRLSNALSGWERRRVEIARALALRPAYLLLDEPFADVDPKGIDDVQALVRQLTHRGIGVLIADQMNQNPRQTLDVSDRAYVICSGDVLGTLMT
jgi:lipopolysaccharide export system ATP-binding protein